MPTGEQVAFVTGASRGIGKAAALALADAGFAVAIGARTRREGDGRNPNRPDEALEGSLERTAAEIQARAGERGRPVPVFEAAMDLRDHGSLTGAVAEITDALGPVDVLVNNAILAGPASMSRVVDTEIADFEAALAANCTAQLVLIKAVLPAMLERGRGRIVNVSSAVAFTDPPAPPGEGGWGLAYAASKAAFHRAAPALAIELGDQGISAFNVSPGMIMTERLQTDQRELGLDGRFPTAPPSVPAAVIAWLASTDDALARNGQTITAQPFALEQGLHPPWA